MDNAFTWTKKSGISTKGFFILGHPTETQASSKQTIDLMLKLDIDNVGLTFFTAYPGSPIYKQIREYGSFDADWDKAKTYDVGNFIPNGFLKEDLIGLRKYALKRFYFRPKYMFKQLLSIKRSYDIYKLMFGFFKAFLKFVLGK